MAFVEINPLYRAYLERQGLTAAHQFLDLMGVVVSGHPDRHVVQVHVGPELRGFLKREHRVHAKDRLANAWEGFGLVSRSVREGRLLRSLVSSGVSGPEFIAAGEDRHGRAFLLMRELRGFVELRAYLRDHMSSVRQRRGFARRLGDLLARLHAAGFDHPDLYSKHVLVQPWAGEIRFLDWQRARSRRNMSLANRCRNLAALHATLADDLATSRDRLAFLQAYSSQHGVGIRSYVHHIRRRASRLLARRRIRELRQAPLAPGSQTLIWLNGASLCVTPEFQCALDGQVPSWLANWYVPPAAAGSDPEPFFETVAAVGSTGPVTLVRRWAKRPFRQLWDWLWRRPLTSPEVRQSGLIFRLQRYGVATPRLLAVGQRRSFPGTVASFLLTEPQRGSVALPKWLETATGRARWGMIRAAADMLRRLHGAGCELDQHQGENLGSLFLVQARASEQPGVVLGSVAPLQIRRHSGSVRWRKDLTLLRRKIEPEVRSRTDDLRFLLAYLGLQHLTPEAKRLAGQLLRRTRAVWRAAP
jgi:tRNA A-37 threonylcarbamoyl transferase component Bud32